MSTIGTTVGKGFLRDVSEFIIICNHPNRVSPNCMFNVTVCIPREPIKGDTSVMTYRGHSVLNTLIRCRFSPVHSTGQRYIYTGCAAGRVVVYDVLTGKIEKVLKGHRSCVRDVSWHPYRPELVSTSVSTLITLHSYRNSF